jgi:prephenate dehydratase
MNIAIQGVLGSFHEIATKRYFANENIDIIQCNTFNDLFDSIEFKKADVGVVAIENTVAGSIIPNYALLKNSGLRVMGEIYLRIEQNLVALSSQNIEDIREINSHPMAIQQCHQFLNPLRRNNVKLIASEDTALSAKRIAENNLEGVAAISSDLAAKIYGLKILEKSIETNKQNFTRFLVISNEEIYLNHTKDKCINKASLSFKLPNEEGSLSRVLSVLAFYKINLTKIQSLPVVGKEWEYMFYIDLVYTDYDKYRFSLNAIIPLTIDLSIIGEYEKAERPLKNVIKNEQILETIISTDSKAFRRVLLVEYPRRGLWSIAFQTATTCKQITKHTEKDLITIFIPTTPNPTSGFLMMVSEKDITYLDMSVDEALKMVISLGVMQPGEQAITFPER